MEIAETRQAAFDAIGLSVFRQAKPASAEESRNTRLALWFERWREPLQRWISSRSTLPAADLDDLVQEVFLRLLRYSSDTAVQYPQTYIFRIAANVASEWRVRTRRRATEDDACLVEMPVDADEQPENSVVNALASSRVRAAVGRLPQRQREVLLLHINEELTCPQIAARLSLTRRIVRRDLANAYAQLRLDLDADLGANPQNSRTKARCTTYLPVVSGQPV